MGQLNAIKGDTYTIVVTVKEPVPELQKRNPRLRLYMFYEAHLVMVSSMAVSVGGVIAAGIGIGILRYRRKRLIASTLAEYRVQDE